MLGCTCFRGVPEGSAGPRTDHWAPGRLHGEGMRWNRTSDRIMAAPIGRDTLPEHWSYGVCGDGRVFFIKWVREWALYRTVSPGLAGVGGVRRCWCNRCFSHLSVVCAAAMRRGPLPGSIPAPVSRWTPDTWSVQVASLAGFSAGQLHLRSGCPRVYFVVFVLFAANFSGRRGQSFRCNEQVCCLVFIPDLPRGWEEGFTREGASYFIK